MISAVTEMESVVKCVEMGATDYLPKPFNPVLLKARVGATLEKKRLRDKERLYAKSLERELEIGREIQKSFLPEKLPRYPGWEIGARFAPARQVAGDFYDAFPLAAPGVVALVVADVCDKGVGAALFMALFRSLLRAAATAEPASAPLEATIGSVVRRTNDYIANNHSSANMFATLFFAALDTATGELRYVNGGHEAPVLLGASEGGGGGGGGSGIRARLAPTGPAVGMMADSSFGVGSARLAPGEGLFAFTDGVTDAKGPAGRFGEEKLLSLLGIKNSTATGTLDAVEAAVREHVAGSEPADDITMLAVFHD
jgi:serine phosphatase RsbU (regulator of sigma subunit)